MDILEFIASLTSTLAWPIAFVVVFLFFRTSLSQLLQSISKISHGNTAVDFDRTAKEVESSIAAIQIIAPEVDLSTRTASRGNNIGKVIVAWMEIENILRKRVAESGEEGSDKLSGHNLISIALKRGLITHDQFKILSGLHVLRNLAAHGKEEDITTERMEDFIALADASKTLLTVWTPEKNL